jgi:hypothetical protein
MTRKIMGAKRVWEGRGGEGRGGGQRELTWLEG